MQEQIPLESKSQKRRKIFGYLARGYRELVSGGDTGITLAKATVTLVFGALAAFGAVAVPVILGCTAVGIVFYIGSALLDEYQRNKKAKEKQIALQNLRQNVSKLQWELNEALNQDAQDKIRNNGADLTNIAPPVLIDNLSNSSLLKLVLHKYMSKLDLLDEEKDFEQTLKLKKRKGVLPGQEGMLRLIETLTGFKRTDAYFATKMRLFLEEHSVPGLKLEDDFYQRLAAAMSLGDPNAAPNPKQPSTSLLATAKRGFMKFFDIKNTENINELEIHPQPRVKGPFTRFRQVVKYGLMFAARYCTAFSLLLGIASLLGGMALAGTPFGWGLLAGCIAVGVISGLASVIYSKVIDKKYDKEVKSLDTEIKHENVKYALLYKLNRLRSKTYADNPETKPSPQPVGDPLADNPALRHNREARIAAMQAEVAKRYKLPTTRLRADLVAQTLYGLSVGGVVGMALGGVVVTILIAFTVLAVGVNPALGLPLIAAVTLAGLIGGAVYGIRYAYWFNKLTRKENKKETQLIKHVEELEQRAKNRFGENYVENKLGQSTQQLVASLLTAYVKLSGKQGGDSEDFFSYKEKVLMRIEAIAGIKRPVDENGQPSNNHDDFYKELALYLRKDKSLAQSEQQAAQFKAAVLGKSVAECQIVLPPPSKLPSLKGIKNTIIDINRNAILNHVYPVLGALGIAAPLGILFFGPAALIAVGVTAGIVMSFFIAHKYLERKAAANNEKLVTIEKNLSLIESIAKTEHKIEKLATNVKQKAPATPPKVVVAPSPRKTAVEKLAPVLSARPKSEYRSRAATRQRLMVNGDARAEANLAQVLTLETPVKGNRAPVHSKAEFFSRADQAARKIKKHEFEEFRDSLKILSAGQAVPVSS